MQGKDKLDVNGVDIFKWEIVKVTVPATHPKTWRDGAISIVVGSNYDWFWWSDCDMEVLWNIHEDPDLLNEV